MFEDMREDDLRSILVQLEVQLGPEMVAELIKKSPPNSIKRNVDWLHVTCCYVSHQDGTCDYYDEEEFEDCWQMKQHQRWLATYNQIVRRLGCSHNYFTNMASVVNIVRRKISDDCASMSPLLEFLRLLMLENSLFLLPTPPSRKVLQTAEPCATADAHSGTALSTEQLSDLLKQE